MVANSLSAFRLLHAKFCFFKIFFVQNKLDNFLQPKRHLLAIFLQNLSKKSIKTYKIATKNRRHQKHYVKVDCWQFVIGNTLARPKIKIGSKINIKWQQGLKCEKICSRIFFQGYCVIGLKKFAIFDIIHLTVYFAYQSML